jgi:hypothetical protein
VVLGAATSLVALCGLINPPPGVFAVFLRTIAGVFALGVYHGAIVLPVALVVLDACFSSIPSSKTESRSIWAISFRKIDISY